MKVVVLTEGSKKQGLGHIIRCGALCESFLKIGIKPYIYINGEGDLDDILDGFYYETVNWIEDREYIFNKINNSDIVIMDSYQADLDFCKKLSSAVRLPVYIDDNERIEYPKGIVVNFNIYYEGLDIRKKDENNYILGAKYIPIRKIFTETLNENPGKSDNVRQILLIFGGSDMRNLSPQILRVLNKDKYSNIRKILISGKMDLNKDKINNIIEDNTEIFCNPAQDIIAKMMISSDMAISSAGMTLYELAYYQIPTIAIAVADNQMDGLREFVKKDFINKFLSWNNPDLFSELENLIDIHINDFPTFKQNAKIGRNIVDGHGSQRIISEIVSIYKKYMGSEG